jgi:hypothetical protein
VYGVSVVIRYGQALRFAVKDYRLRIFTPTGELALDCSLPVP